MKFFFKKNGGNQGACIIKIYFIFSRRNEKILKFVNMYAVCM